MTEIRRYEFRDLSTHDVRDKVPNPERRRVRKSAEFINQLLMQEKNEVLTNGK